MAIILVTGVAGFIGSHIAEYLLRGNNIVIGMDDLSAGYVENVPKGVVFLKDDVCNIGKYDSVMKDVDVVFHNAASKKNICLKNPVRDMEVNGIGTLKLLQSSLKNGVSKFIHASTGSVYGEVKGIITEDTPRKPVSFYGISKMAGESYVQYFHDAYKLNTTILRYFHVYGDRQESNPETGGVVSIFTKQIINGDKIKIHGTGLQKRVFTHVSDIVKANIKAWLKCESVGQIYNCASSHQLSIVDLANHLMKKYNKQTSYIYTERLDGDIDDFDVDNRKIKDDLGVTFQPIINLL